MKRSGGAGREAPQRPGFPGQERGLRNIVLKHTRHRSRMKRSLLVCMLLGLICPVPPAHAAKTQDVFRRFQDRVVQIRILEASSGSRVSLGSGFSVSRSGEIITNFHVISGLVHDPQRYRAEILYFDGSTSPLTLLDFDAVHDLAVVSGRKPSPFFDLHAPPLMQGTRVFSLGVPLDLGFTIVEGTYNGLLKNSQYENIHFTGAINPGMSGGPAILDDGRVIGVNVMSAGNQVGFLVPAKFVIGMLKRTRTAAGGMPFLEKLTAQLMENQKHFMAQLLAGGMQTVHLGPYLLPDRIAPYLKCWGDNDKTPDDLFEHLSHICSSDDAMYVSNSHFIRLLRIEHHYLDARELGPRRFYNLFENYFSSDNGHFYAGKKDVTGFSCQSGFVENAGLTMRTVLCLRSYRKLPGLYDAVLKVATLDSDREGAAATVELGGVSYDNAVLFARKYLEGISWKKK